MSEVDFDFMLERKFRTEAAHGRDHTQVLEGGRVQVARKGLDISGNLAGFCF